MERQGRPRGLEQRTRFAATVTDRNLSERTPIIDWPAVQARANSDAEFRLHARFWNATVRFGIGARGFKMRVQDGNHRAVAGA